MNDGEATARRRGPVVDVHAHALLPALDRLVGDDGRLAAYWARERRRNGAPSAQVNVGMVAERVPQLTDVDRRLRDMDAAGVDRQIVSASPSQYHYWADPPLATALCRAANEAIAELAAVAPERLGGLGLVPLQHPGLMVDALDHAVEGCGLAGVEISSHADTPDGGRVELSDPRLDAFWARAGELGAVVLLHPFGCTLEERLDRFYLSNTVGQPVEHAVALSHVIFGGVLDRHPGLRLVACHGGGYLPTSIGRADHGWAHRPDARSCARPPSSYLRELWFDSLVFSADGLRALVGAVGADRVLLGSDYPFDMGVADPVERLAAAGLDPAAEAAILGGNARDLGLTHRDRADVAHHGHRADDQHPDPDPGVLAAPNTDRSPT
ncbi:MAG: amidohydrolase family protein [Actinomycetota bacterium]|nr:amidohydrolase family protein [Actinomycetota bacterium]